MVVELYAQKHLLIKEKEYDSRECVSEYRMRKHPCFEKATMIDKKAHSHSRVPLDRFSIFMMHVLLTVAYGILWTINLIRERK